MEKGIKFRLMGKRHILKRIVFSVIMLVLVLITLELVLNLAYFTVKWQRFPYSAYKTDIFRIAGGDDGLSPEIKFSDDDAAHHIYGVEEVIHPYLGFVREPGLMHVSKWGFPGEYDDPFHVDEKDTLVIAIHGGSFADGVARRGRRALQKKLEENGIRSRVINFAVRGYKQPQQLATLVWLLSEGANIDVVVNIDGFNEVALTTAENIPQNVYPFYPRAWPQRVLRVHNREELRLIARGDALSEKRQAWAERFRDTVVPRSIMLNIIWKARDRRIESGIHSVNNDLLEKGRSSSGTDFLRSGPVKQFPEDQMYERIAAHWASCSRLMNQLSRSNGLLYIHLLQPNQYFGGKELTQEEKMTAWRDNHRYRPGVVHGYPLLVKKGRNLRSAGVDFHNITYIYKDVEETIYVDDCCHANSNGYEMVAEYLASVIIARTGKP